jgi:hypothetical protein
VASLLTAAFYQGNHDMNNILWNIASAERHTLCVGAAVMLLHTSGKFKMGKIEIIFFGLKMCS